MPAQKKPAPKKPAPKKAGKSAPVERVKVSKVRTLGEVGTRAKKTAPKKTAPKSPKPSPMARKAHALLADEFERALAMKQKLGAEGKVGGDEKGRDIAGANEKVRGIIASLEGMNRFALKMGLITPAEARAMYVDAMSKGLHGGVK